MASEKGLRQRLDQGNPVVSKVLRQTTKNLGVPIFILYGKSTVVEERNYIPLPFFEYFVPGTNGILGVRTRVATVKKMESQRGFERRRKSKNMNSEIRIRRRNGKFPTKTIRFLKLGGPLCDLPAQLSGHLLALFQFLFHGTMLNTPNSKSG